MAHSTNAHSPSKRAKRPKPHPDFPLFHHHSNRWAKKVNGRFHYFGSTNDDPKGQEALKHWLEQKDDILAGRKPRRAGDYVTLRDLCNRFLTAKRNRLLSGELAAVSFHEYHRCCERILSVFGKARAVEDIHSEDFEELRAELAKTLGPVALTNEITRMRSIFKYAFDAELIDKPIRYGQSFAKPSRRVLRKARNERGQKIIPAAELRKIINAAKPPFASMLLLGLNCGFGAKDCSDLPRSALRLPKGRKLTGGWLNFPRPKTGVHRRAPLWPETVKALREALKVRPDARLEDDAGLVYITKYGNRWVRQRVHKDENSHQVKAVRVDAVGQEFKKITTDLGLHRKGMGFYWLRHVFETIGSQTPNQNVQVAVDCIMGHADDANDMSARYREGCSDEQLMAVTEHVRSWLFETKLGKKSRRKKSRTKGRAK